MKLLFAGDIHGSLYYGNKIFERMAEEKPEKLVLLGDLLYHGARNDLPKEYDTKGLTRLLNSHKNEILAVRGNCDSEVDQMVLEFPIMADYAVIYADDLEMLITHGHVFDENSMIPHAPGTVLVHGHTHLKVQKKTEDFYYMNPGSASIPKDDDRHSYMIYENHTFTIKDLETGETIQSMTI